MASQPILGVREERWGTYPEYELQDENFLQRFTESRRRGTICILYVTDLQT